MDSDEVFTHDVPLASSMDKAVHLSVWKRLSILYSDMMSRGDPRTSEWFLMSSPWPTTIMCIIYLISIYVGKRMMQQKAPIECRRVLISYNFSLVIFSGWMVYEFLASAWLSGYSLICQPVDYSYSENALRMARVIWWYYFSKLVELMDTIFFVIRKKFELITFLHVFHHTVMPFSWWFGVKYVPGGFSAFGALMNSIVHVFMYVYYAVAAMGPKYQRYVWWKKYLTKMQLIQFGLVGAHCVQMYFIKCDFPLLFVTWVLFYMVIFICLFTNFYIQAYRRRSPKKNSLKESAVSNGSSESSNHSIIANGKDKQN
jgi:hypothetical protein